MRKIIYVAVMFLFLTGFAFAQDTALVSTDITSVDSAVAGAAGDQAGAPVIVAENGGVPASTVSDLQSEGVKNIILIGGPAVLNTDLENQLNQSGFSVIRLWGNERTDTAVVVAKYFWPAGAACAVLVDDTMNSTADAGKEHSASNIATRYNCTLIPVSTGTVPAEVLTTLSDLNVKTVWYVGMPLTQAVRDALKNFVVKEVTGDDNQIRNQTENGLLDSTKNPKLVIVAAPTWNIANAFAAQPNDNSVVRFVTSVDQISDLITVIQSKNITDVRVVGIPDLANQIAANLTAYGINVSKVSGNDANELARNLLKEYANDWTAKSQAAEMAFNRTRDKVKTYLNSELNKTEDTLNTIQTQAGFANLPALNASIADLQTKLDDIKAALAAGNLEKARALIAEISSDAQKRVFENRDDLRKSMPSGGPAGSGERNSTFPVRGDDNRTMMNNTPARTPIKPMNFTAGAVFADNPDFANAYLISGDSLTADEQKAISGFEMHRQTLPDGTLQITLKALSTKYTDEVYNLKPGQKLYFIERFLGDDTDNDDSTLRDDMGVIVNDDGTVAGP